MLDVINIMFIPNTFPILLHKNLGQGAQNENHHNHPYTCAHADQMKPLDSVTLIGSLSIDYSAAGLNTTTGYVL